MSVSILEALQNADYNLSHNGMLGVGIAAQQVHNAVVLLEKGYPLSAQVETLIEQWGEIEKVPDHD